MIPSVCIPLPAKMNIRLAWARRTRREGQSRAFNTVKGTMRTSPELLWPRSVIPDSFTKLLSMLDSSTRSGISGCKSARKINAFITCNARWRHMYCNCNGRMFLEGRGGRSSINRRLWRVLLARRGRPIRGRSCEWLPCRPERLLQRRRPVSNGLHRGTICRRA